MEQKFSDDELAELEIKTRLMADLCDAHGQADGANAARSQNRAIRAEIERRANNDAAAGH